MLKLEEFLPLSWDDYFELVNELVDQIIESGEKYDRIVGITRAGLTLGHFLSDALSLPISVFTIKSYVNIDKQEDVEITENLSADIQGHKILLVDEVSDRGKTFEKAVPYLKTKKPKSVTTASIFLKPHSSFKPDFYSQVTPKWILFPYEFTENAILLRDKVKEEGGDLESILLTLGYSKHDIELLKKRKVL